MGLVTRIGWCGDFMGNLIMTWSGIEAKWLKVLLTMWARTPHKSHKTENENQGAKWESLVQGLMKLW